MVSHHLNKTISGRSFEFKAEGYWEVLSCRTVYINEKRWFNKILCIKSLSVTIQMKTTE